MNEVLQEFVNSRGVAMRVERERGIIRGVKLLGFQSRNGRRYLPAALASAAALYEGAKVNVNHPKGNPLAARDYQDRLGSVRNVSVCEDGLFGDLHFNPKHALAEQLAWDAAHAPENVGFSHNVEARTSREANQIVVEAILKVQSVDLVADPATTRGLFESAGQSASEGHDTAGASQTAEAIAAGGVLVEGLAGPAAEIASLRTQLDRLQACIAVHERREVARRLLREFKLPDPVALGGSANAIVSDLFLETVLSASDERAMRSLVQERAETIAAARKTPHGVSSPARPVSREQYPRETADSLDAREFARAISG
jgi:hypothetical protein